MLSANRIQAISFAIAAMLQALDYDASAASAWRQIEEIFPPFREQARLKKSFSKKFPKVNKTAGHWRTQVMRAEADRAERNRPRNVGVTATARRNDKFIETKRQHQKKARFPDYDPIREQRGKRFRAERELEAAIAEVSARIGWAVLAITITMSGKKRGQCKDYYDKKFSNFRKRLEKNGPVSEQIALVLMTELTGREDDLSQWVGDGVEHVHGFVACPVTDMPKILDQLRREFGEIGFARSPDQPRERFTPVLLTPIFDARGWAEYCCKRVGAVPERARARATGKRFRMTCGIRIKKQASGQENRGNLDINKPRAVTSTKPSIDSDILPLLSCRAGTCSSSKAKDVRSSEISSSASAQPYRLTSASAYELTRSYYQASALAELAECTDAAKTTPPVIAPAKSLHRSRNQCPVQAPQRQETFSESRAALAGWHAE